MPPDSGWTTRFGDLLVKYEKLVGQTLVVGDYFGLWAVLRRAWPGADRGTMLTLLGLTSGLLAFAQVQWLQWLTGRHIAVLPPRRPTEWVVWGLVAACFVAAVLVTADERRAETNADEQQRLNDEWDARLRQTVNDPKVREGFETLRALGERRAARVPATTRAAAGTRPAAR
jgi:hypothetical protein